MYIIASLIGLALGLAIGYGLRIMLAKRNASTAEQRAERLLSKAQEEHQTIIRNAKGKHQDILLEAKDKSLKIIEEAKQEHASRRQELRQTQSRLDKRESMLDKRFDDLDQRHEKLQNKIEKVKAIKEQIEQKHEEKIIELERIAGLDQGQAKQELFKHIEKQHEDALVSRIRKLEQMHEEEIERRSRKILSLAIERYASSHCVDTTTSLVELPSDDMKGRIIGKEGRNIKALEMLTGTEIIVDDTPEVITVSAFSAIRRQVAKLALERLIKDGRIHPGRIEKFVEKAKKDLAKEVRRIGEDALHELGIPLSSIDPKLISILGRLKFRTSYGQNVLQHSIEVAQLSAMMAEELGADVHVCKKGGLFHDIGKAVDHDMQGAHPEIGYNIMKKFGFAEEVAYQSIAHHEDKPKTVEGVIVKAADGISGARPGARKQSLEQFLQRMEELEQTASNFHGVKKTYAIQAGREVRVFVEPEEIDDLSAHKLAEEIATKIESELSYPGEVKVTLIRETRVIEFAR